MNMLCYNIPWNVTRDSRGRSGSLGAGHTDQTIGITDVGNFFLTQSSSTVGAIKPNATSTTTIRPLALMRPVILNVCTSCRTPGTPREPRENRPGFQLYKGLKEALSRSVLNTQVTVRPAECLSLCPRPCGIALSSAGRWTYLFGDQAPMESPGPIIDLISLYLSTGEGLMPRNERPMSLQSSVLGRVPPMEIDESNNAKAFIELRRRYESALSEAALACGQKTFAAKR